MAGTEKRLMVIDDDQDIRDIVREIFEHDYAVRCLADVDDIFSEISHFRPDVILIDYRLGVSNGADICYQIKSNAGTLHIPVVLFSAHHREIDNIGNYGWNAFIGKPFDIDHIRQVIGKFVKNNP